MNTLYKGLAVALLHVLMVLSLGGKLLYDRHTRPRVWVKAASYDPNLPIRGRYVALQVQVRMQGINRAWNQNVVLSEEKGELVGTTTEENTGVMVDAYGMLSQPVLFFLPEHVKDPSWLQRGQELWVEVTVPRKGPPRPIQLAVKDQTGWHPLNLR